ncbi:WD40-repeat-containing domain protein [Collybia nuda]|uniref:WD40-repeat-containing domain protein n=1 Tax=Collybia nuda TaxID=64659 RepID=A0A9P5Y1W0_9AGAR|nr:WD40-repeat-containing domain protein [Collybia nuda]
MSLALPPSRVERPQLRTQPLGQRSDLSPGYIQLADANAFSDFNKQVGRLEFSLLAFGKAIKQLAGSTSTIASVKSVSGNLDDLCHAVRENASHLCPGKIHRRFHQSSKMKRAEPQKIPDPSQIVTLEESDLSTIILEMRELGHAVVELLNNITSLAQFEDREIQTAFNNLGDDLQYWARCLENYDGRFEDMSVRRYVNDLTVEFCEHIDTMLDSLSYFTETAIPMLAISQHHDPANIQNLTTVATFFSAVTATTLQFSYSQSDVQSSVVNGFWFSSLVFSVASTVNLLLGALLMRVLYRTPVRVPRPIYLWLYGSPLVFLVTAVACFSIGLVAFVYSSNQRRPVSVITTAFSAFSYLGIAVVLAWFAYAHTIFTYNEAQRSRTVSNSVTINSSTQDAAQRRSFRNSIGSPGSVFKWRNSLASHDPEAMASSNENQEDEPQDVDQRRLALMAMFSWATAVPFADQRSQPRHPTLMAYEPFRSYVALSNDHINNSVSPSERVRIWSNNTSQPPEKTGIRDISFSPDGMLLAVCGEETAPSIWSVDPSILYKGPKLHCWLRHTGGPVDQVAWSHNGHFLITKMRHVIAIWRRDGALVATIQRRNRIKSVIWMPNEDAFLSLEGSVVSKLGISENGEALHTFAFGRMFLRSMTVCMVAGRAYLVVSAIEPPMSDDLRPSKEKLHHRCIIVYDMGDKEIVTQIPIFHDIKRLISTEDGRHVLVNFKDETSPQLYELRVTGEQDKISASLILVEVYASRKTRLTCFGGNDNEFVLCTDQDGDVSIFERDGGSLQHHASQDWKVEDQRCLHWNRASQDILMFAAGSAEEGVRFWIANPRKRLENVDTGDANEGVVEARLRTNAPRPLSAMFESYARTYLPFFETPQEVLQGKEGLSIPEVEH